MLPAKLARYRLPALVSAVVLTMFTVAGVVSADLSADDPGGIREVVQQQLAAFEHDDAKRAFALADPDVRSKFQDAEHFMQMVRAHYPMVHRPTAVEFMPAEFDGTLAFQRLRLTDSGGMSWMVTYLLNRQQDKQWRISACLVVPDTPRLST